MARKHTHRSVTGLQGLIEHVCKISGSNSPKRRDLLTLDTWAIHLEPACLYLFTEFLTAEVHLSPHRQPIEIRKITSKTFDSWRRFPHALSLYITKILTS